MCFINDPIQFHWYYPFLNLLGNGVLLGVNLIPGPLNCNLVLFYFKLIGVLLFCHILVGLICSIGYIS